MYKLCDFQSFFPICARAIYFFLTQHPNAPLRWYMYTGFDIGWNTSTMILQCNAKKVRRVLRYASANDTIRTPYPGNNHVGSIRYFECPNKKINTNKTQTQFEKNRKINKYVFKRVLFRTQCSMDGLTFLDAYIILV